MTDIFTNERMKDLTYNGLLEIMNQAIIYKYIDLETAIHKILSIDGINIRFSNPEKFNDPFDCHEGLINFTNINHADVKEFLSNRKKTLDRKNRRLIVRQTNEKKNVCKFFRKKKEKYKISCFSKNYNNPLMWAHYADKHTGVCIGYSFPVLPDNFRVYNVTYRKNILPVDSNIEEDRVMYYWLTNKAIYWEYEQEVRAVTRDIGRDIITVDKIWCKELIFGCNVKDQDLNKAVKLIRRSGYKHIKIKKMVLNNKDFSLNEISIPI